METDRLVRNVTAFNALFKWIREHKLENYRSRLFTVVGYVMDSWQIDSRIFLSDSFGRFDAGLGFIIMIYENEKNVYLHWDGHKFNQVTYEEALLITYTLPRYNPQISW